MAPTTPAIAPRESLRALLAEVFADPASACGYAVAAVAFDAAVEVTLVKGPARFVVWVRPGSHPTDAYRRTERFKIGHDPDPPDRAGYAVIDALCVRLMRWEQEMPVAACRQLFESPESAARASAPPGEGAGALADQPSREWLAVAVGLKPACRNLVDPPTAQRLIETARADGLHARVTTADAFVGGFCSGAGRHGATTLVYVGRTAAAADAAWQAERAMIDSVARGARVADVQVRALGGLLGYPACCIEAFLPVRDLSPPEIRFHALRRTRGAAAALLNDIVEQRAFISHAVCGYDCAASRRSAQALLEEVARRDATAARQLESDLSGLVVMLRSDGALRLVAARPTESGAYRFSGCDGAGGGAQFDRWRAALQAGDGLRIAADVASVLRGDEVVARLDVPADAVQIRLFA